MSIISRLLGPRPRMKAADDALKQAISDMERTIIRRPSYRATPPPPAANDTQKEVIFATYWPICQHRYSNSLIAICKHPEHEGHGTGTAVCEQNVCPFMLGKVK